MRGRRVGDNKKGASAPFLLLVIDLRITRLFLVAAASAYL